MKQKSELRNLQKFLKNNSISLKKFLIIYCNIDCDSLLEIELSHKDIKILIPDLKRISFESLCNDVRLLYTGKVIAVEDSYGNIVPYVCPEQKDNSNPTIQSCKRNIFDELENLIFNNNLNRYQLSILCKKLKENKKIRDYRIAKKLIKSKKDFKTKKYIIGKYKFKREEE